jgi:hypothetical protein
MDIDPRLLEWIGNTVKRTFIPETGRVVAINKRHNCGHFNCIVCLQTSTDGLWIVLDGGNSFTIWCWDRVQSKTTFDYTEEGLFNAFIDTYKAHLTSFDLLLAGELYYVPGGLAHAR